jgi:arylsulfatase A-like enzyme
MGIIPLLAALNLSAWLIEFHSSPSVSGDHRERSQQWWETDGDRFEYVLRYRVNPVLTLIWSPLIAVEQSVEGTLTEEQLGPRRSDRHLVERASGSGARRSLIAIAVEALRHDVIGLRHQGREIMPHVNRLAGGGVHFTNAYSQSTHSDYADPCIVSSLYPLRTRGHHYYSRSDPWPKVLIYDVLKQHGYATAIISSQNEGWGRMDQFLASPHLDLFFDSRDYDGETFVCDRDPGFARFVKGARVAGKLDDRITIQKVIGWIGEQQAADVPFFVSVNLQTSHFPYEIPGGRTGPFQPATMDFPASFVSYPRDKVPVVRNAYYNALHYIDQQIGRLVSFLDEAGLRDETLLVIAGDNGEAFYENGHPTHAGPPYEPAIRVGLLMHCPAVLDPATETYLVQLIDVAPDGSGFAGTSRRTPAFRESTSWLPTGPPTNRTGGAYCIANRRSAGRTRW